MLRRMPALSVAIFAIAIFTNVVCQAQPQSLLTRHVRDAVVNGQAHPAGRLPANQSMRLVVVLPLRHQTELDNFLDELYNPSSSIYRQFLTVDEFTARFGPSQSDYDAVVRFAKANGFEVVGTSRNRMNVDIKGPVSAIEKAFHVNMGVYQHPTENRTFYAPDREPTADLPFALWHISGLDNFSKPQPMFRRRSEAPRVISNATTGSCPSASFCGSDMRAAYYGATTLTGTGQTLGLLEYYGTDLADLTKYYKNADQTEPFTPTIISTDGTSTSCTAASGCDDTEQTLDMTQAMGMAPGMTMLYMYVGSVDTAIFNAMATHSPLDAQLSSSWTWTPEDASTLLPYFTEFAAQGQNMFQAAGDSGVWKTSSSVWPSDSVYVTSVGGTDLTTASAGGPWKSETVWVDGGGGVSPDKFTIPAWQTSYINFSTCTKCSSAYRNAPDVSANANFTFYVCADQTTCTANSYGGTSFAAPMWAGFLALVNQQAVANSEPLLGFVNPALYMAGAGSSYSTDFHDITSGSNGDSATVGFDLATGWGSPMVGLINTLAPPPSSGGFSMSVSPSTVSVAQGGTGTSSITTTLSGSFNSAITLSASGQPTGVTLAFNPNPIPAPGAGTSTVTITVAATTATGTYSITVTGTGASTTHTAMITLTVTPAVEPTTTSLTSAPNPSGLGQTVTFTATVLGSGGAMPTGSVTFLNGATTIGTGALNASGVAVLKYNGLLPGNNSITATYGGASGIGPSTSAPVNQFVEKRL
jgi:subtilase family serine protease